MRIRKAVLPLAAVCVMTCVSAFAQVQRVVVEAQGISRACSPGLEAALKSLDSVYKYAISVDKQMFSVTYYQGEKFKPKDLLWVADKGEAEVRKIHISAMGTVEDQGDKQVFVAGEDRFDVVSPTKLPVGVKIGVMGVVDEKAEPIQIHPDDFKVLTDESTAPGSKSESEAQSEPEKAPEKR